MGSKRRKYLVVATVAAIVAALSGYWAWLKISEEIAYMDCQDNFAYISRHLDFDALGCGAEEGAFFTDELKLETAAPPETWICPGCGERYVYRPVTPGGDRVPVGNSPSRFVLWCPRPCHGGKRGFLWSDFGHLYLADGQVSWYYQTFADKLTPEEREQENAYRAQHGMQPLPAKKERPSK